MQGYSHDLIVISYFQQAQFSSFLPSRAQLFSILLLGFISEIGSRISCMWFLVLILELFVCCVGDQNQLIGGWKIDVGISSRKIDVGISSNSTSDELIGENIECQLIDPADRTVDRDLSLIQELGLKFVYAINTHVHADHVTGTGLIKVSVEYGLYEMMSWRAIRLEVAPKNENWGFNISEREAMLSAGTVDKNVERVYKEEKKRMDVNCLQNHSIQSAYHVAQRLLCLKYSNQVGNTIRPALMNLKEYCIKQKL
ncbi:hypothetical protein MTR_5g097770 [Medicago truncatula]|uniref:Uncharacterized protein n=1 Tax=Medicago truncatula TaxID=3880 RepID=G7K4X7_MEDTR|nr:hypothetical protein MTR_5g097770 [Medicago truncatula]